MTKTKEQDKMNDIKLDTCHYCNDTGLRPVANGQDDYDMELCECKQP